MWEPQTGGCRFIERDEDADYDVMQYYDVSSRYDIPSNPETVTSEKAGEVYYSDPNRIVLFYHDAGDYRGIYQNRNF